MGRLSKKDEALTFETYCNSISNIVDNFAGSAEKSLNLMAEEGIWLALGFNTFIILGRVGPDKPIEYAQRQTLVQTLRALTGAANAAEDLKNLELSIPNLADPLRLDPIKFKPFEGLVDWFLPPFIGASGDIITPQQPLQIIYGFIQPIIVAAQIQDEDGVYLPLPFHYRLIVSAVLPGIVRSLVDILAQRSTLTLG